MNLLVVGNGSIGISENSEFYINNHTGYFLLNLKRSHNVTFAQGSTKYNKDNNLQNFELEENEIEYSILPRTKTTAFFPAVLNLLKSSDFVYLFYPGTLSKVMALVAIVLNKPFGLYIRGQYYNQNKIDRVILKKAKFILTISPSFAKDLLQFCTKVEVIRPMIAIEQSDLKRDRNYKTPKKWNLLFVGRVEERKGIRELLQIAKHLQSAKFDFCLNIVGGGDLFTETNKIIKELHLVEKVILHGLVSDKDQLRALYNDANAFVFTSHDEGFPRVLYEAMASGLPIFTTFVGGISGRMEHLRNCIEIPVKNADEAANIVSKYLTDEKILEEIGRNGQKALEKIIDGSLLTHEELLLKQLKDEK
jgi:glycosyltransferase involved in cell wall biosynthesis